ALARQLRRIEGQALLFRHPDRDRLKLAQPAGAAQLPPAQPDAAELFRFITDADLAELDANPELAGQIPHQLPKVDPRVGREEKSQPIAVERVLGVDEPHRQSPSRYAFL